MNAPPPQDEPHQRTRWARWGMLLVSLAMGLTLVATALIAWDDAKSAAVSVGEARAVDVFRAVRRALREPTSVGREDLASVAEEFADAGLRYVGVLDRDGGVYVESGQALGSRRTGRIRDPGDLRPVPVGERLRVESQLGPRAGARGARLAIEVDPVFARSLEKAAKHQLIASGVVALVLAAMALYFWRLMLRADRLEQARARDRRLAALGSMSAILGHELRNPLASLKGHAQLALEKTAEHERTRKNLERVVAEAERLERLTGQILAFARTGQLDLAEESPAELVRAVVEKAGDPRLQTDMARAPGRWRLDRARMEQVLTNLIANAREHTPEGGLIRVSAARVEGGLELTVEDGGPGFTPDERGRLDWVFEPFQTAGKIYGTGLGLAIARQIVEAHGGRIQASNRATGAVVTLLIPGDS